jgi:hypothetical protein
MARCGRVWPETPALQRFLILLWPNLVGCGLRIVVHTGEVQGSIPCEVSEGCRAEAQRAKADWSPQIANTQTAMMVPRVASPLMVQPAA